MQLFGGSERRRAARAGEPGAAAPRALGLRQLPAIVSTGLNAPPSTR